VDGNELNDIDRGIEKEQEKFDAEVKEWGGGRMEGQSAERWGGK